MLLIITGMRGFIRGKYWGLRKHIGVHRIPSAADDNREHFYVEGEGYF